MSALIIVSQFFFILVHNAGYAQDINGESVWRENILHGLDTTTQDTSRVLLTAELANYYKFHLPDSALFYGYRALESARQIKFPQGEVDALEAMIHTQTTLGNDSKALQMALQGLKIAERNNLIYDKALLLGLLGHIYREVENYRKALSFFRESMALLDSLHDSTFSTLQQSYIGETYLTLNHLDSALYYCQSAHEIAVRLNEPWVISNALIDLGKIQLKKGNDDLALAYFRQSLPIAANADMIFNSYFAIAQVYQETNKSDSCIYYVKKSLEPIEGRGFYSDIIKASLLLSNIYEKKDAQKALEYSKLAILYKDSLDNLGKTTSFENLLAFDEQERQYEIEAAEAAYRSKVKQYGLIAGSLVLLLIGLMLYRTNRIRMNNEIVSQQHKASELEMQALRAQMNPHFIFNSLNSINMFILENNKLQAAEYLSKFSRLVRLILQNSQEAFIALEREVKALELYLELESLRFEHKFEYKISVDDEVDTTVLKVPPLIIQPYAENAIWHGLMHKHGKGHLEIELYQQKEILFCKIIDDGIGRKKAEELKSKSASKNKSMGMHITADRIAMLQQQKQNSTFISVTDLVLPDGNPVGTEVLIKIPSSL
ncbi:MAG TPA: histidine kinase [Chitinophagaceae bacterium]